MDYSINAPEVSVLRNFRDGFLLKSRAENYLLSASYSASPDVALVVSENTALSPIARAHLRPVVRAVSLITNMK